MQLSPSFGLSQVRVAALVLCLCWSTSGIADPAKALQKACSIELSRLKAPHAYLVAIVSNTTPPNCDDIECTASLSVIKVLAAGDQITDLSSINVSYSRTVRENGGGYPQGETIGVFVPALGGKTYAWLRVTSPASQRETAQYEQAIAMSESPTPLGALHCDKSSVP